MNRQLNSRDQHGTSLNWTTQNWDTSNTNRDLEITPYQGSRVDHWDWESPMILRQNIGAGLDGAAAGAGECSDHGYEDHKPQTFLPGLLASSVKPYAGLLPLTNFGSTFHHSNNNIGVMETSGIQPFGGIDFISHSLGSPPALLHESYGFSNFSGLPATANTNQTNDFRFLDEQRRNRLLGILGSTDFKTSTDLIQPNEIYSAESHARIGLNLGYRTYFSSEDTIFGRLGKRHRASSPGSLQVPMCQAEGCKADLSHAKHYHRRHKVCELHSKAATVVTNGQNQRFCQQCSRFQPLSEFDEGKRSCRKRLADHNRRRRKPQPTAATTSTAEPLPLKAEDQPEQSAANTHSPTEEGKPAVDQNVKAGSSPSSGSLENFSGTKASSSFVGDKALHFHASSRYNPQADQTPAATSEPSSSRHSPPLLAPPASDNSKSFPVSQPMPFLILPDNADSKFPAALGSAAASQPLVGNLIRATGLGLSSSAIRDGTSHNYNAAVNTFSWLKSGSNPAADADHFNLSATRSHDQEIQETIPLSSLDTTKSDHCQSDMPDYFPSVQNLLPFQSCSDAEQSEWILKNVTPKTKPPPQSQAHPQYKPSSCLNYEGSVESSQGLPFLDCPSVRAAVEQVQPSRAPVDFLQKGSTMGSVNCTDEGEDAPGIITELKFPELQTLRPFGSIYDHSISFV